MDEFTRIISIFAIVMTIAGAAAFIWAYYMASLNKAQLASLRGDRDDLIQRVELLEASREELKQKAIEKDRTLAEAYAKITVLEGIVTHDASIKELIRAVDAHDRNVEKKYDTYMSVISQVLVSVERLLEAEEARNASQ